MLNRRNFMKMCGVVAVSPLALMGKSDIVDDELVIDMTFPSYIYEGNTGRCKVLNLDNPADYAIHVLTDCGYVGKFKQFYEWSEYCDKAGLRIPVRSRYNNINNKTVLDVLCEMCQYGNAMWYYEGGTGTLKVIYGLPESMLQGRKISMVVMDETYSSENMI